MDGNRPCRILIKSQSRLLFGGSARYCEGSETLQGAEYARESGLSAARSRPRLLSHRSSRLDLSVGIPPETCQLVLKHDETVTNDDLSAYQIEVDPQFRFRVISFFAL